MSAAPKFLMINTEDLVESPLNPRKDFDATKLAELAASVKEKGVLEPILVRPLKDGGYEVAAGARRFRAAKVAELATVPALVRDMTDAELLEVAILENVVRSDISALEEGDAYRTLIENHGYTVEQLVEKTGKSRTVVFQRMKLAELDGPLRTLVLAGHLTPSVAELLARLPTPSMQMAALATLKEKAHWRYRSVDADESDLSGVPFREAKEILDQEFRLHLKSAPFDTKDAELVAVAGACVACPKRTAHEKDLFPGIKEDTCLDSACWKKKEQAAFAQLKAEAKLNGKTLVKKKEVFVTDYDGKKKLTAAVAKDFARPTEPVLGEKTWKDLLGALEVPTVTVLDADNKTHNLVDKKAALELLEQVDPKKAAKMKEAPPAKDNWEIENAKRRAKEELERMVANFVQSKALPQVKTLDDAAELFLLGMASDKWEWGELLRFARLPKDTKLEKLKPAERVRLMVAGAFRTARFDARKPMTAWLAQKAKLDVKKLQKQAAAAEKGTCFVCGCTEEKACDGDCEWADEGQKLCSSCAEEE